MRQTRAVLLPSTADPFLMRQWFKSFEIWKDEVDKIYVLLNSDADPVLAAQSFIYIGSILLSAVGKDKFWIEGTMPKIDHGPAIDQMLEVCTEDLILLIEEDALVFKKGVVDEYFKLIEDGEYDLVGSARGSTGKEIWKRGNELWPDTPEQAPHFWPNFLFCKRADLLKTDRNFSAKAWYKGDYIKELDLTITDEVIYADSFVWASIQLRAKGLRVKLVEQYHSRIEDLEDFTQVKGIFDRKAPWVHIGSLSGWWNVLMAEELQFRIGEVNEWERRASFWLLCYENSEPDKLPEFRERYKKGIDRLIDEYTLSLPRVKYRADLYRRLIENDL